MPRDDIQTRFGKFTASVPAGGRIAVLGHSDADGLSAAAILARALRSAGFDVTADVTRKGESAWSESALARVSRTQPAALVLADLGSRAEPLLPGIPALLVDHHKPTGAPAGAELLTSYGESDPATSGLLAYWCAAAIGRADGLDWMAAVSILADLGDKSSLSEWATARKKYGYTKLREVTTLLNSPRRAASGDATPALRLLLDATSPSAFLADAGIEELRAAKAEYDAALAEGRRVGPTFRGPVALITVNSPCQIHPALAQMWSPRLRKNIVICANEGFLPGRVNFSARTSLDINLIDFLAKHRPPDAGEEFGRGHDKATGGSLTPEQWNQFVEGLVDGGGIEPPTSALRTQRSPS